ncbi:uncharacterized protein PHALS_08098 [Plasmopara halstedii]|uniref:Uncharacterized protein n=1 Tax=Plasmopara halstedii TaxID=4781 RepID=A0A0P1B7D2_PLAHL|nr:uncharacterized protein PHALS_08098 [Plasmopara halstedii]CEG50386.1 hypothetical protein PHALS_08098 [Plasmopara halstedii]|eukprot:XP_024586755.1 hypothetical protein PHALS_08098 [Plasmopara halstedii]
MPHDFNSCLASNIVRRKVPSLALLPRGYLKCPLQISRKESNSIQDKSPNEKQNDILDRVQTTVEATTLLNAVQQEAVFDKSSTFDEETDCDKTCDSYLSKQRLNDRFLNMMALMERLSVQSLEDTHVNNIVSSLETVPHHSPIDTQIVISKLDDRQSLVHFPIRRKRLRKRRRKARKTRQKWETSHVTWPQHALIDYVADHSHCEPAEIRAFELSKRLETMKCQDYTSRQPKLTHLPSFNHTFRSISKHLCHNREKTPCNTIRNNCDVARIKQKVACKVDTQSFLSKAPVSDVRNQPVHHHPIWISPAFHSYLLASQNFPTKPSSC